MNVEHLRSTLREHAQQPLDVGSASRSAAVHRRVRIVRRRRQAGAGAAIAALVAAVAVVLPLGEDAIQPADQAPAELAGRPVPQTQTAAGFDYEYVRGYESEAGKSQLTVKLAKADEPRLVMWASSETNDKPVLELSASDGATLERSSAGAFTRFRLVPAGSAEELELYQRGLDEGERIAMAVYELSDSTPTGVSNGTVTFRDRVLDSSLVDGVIGDPGENDLRMEVDLPAGGVRLSELCYGTDQHFKVSVDGEQVLSGTCDTGEPYFDPGSSVGFATATPGSDGPVEVRIWLTDTERSTDVVTDDGAVLGLGLYDNDIRTTRVAGMDVPDAIERLGNEYIATEHVESTPGDRVLRLTLPESDLPRVVSVVANGRGGPTAMARLQVRTPSVGKGDGPTLQSIETVARVSASAGLGSISSPYVVQPGQSVILQVLVGDGAPQTQVGLVVSELVPQS